MRNKREGLNLEYLRCFETLHAQFITPCYKLVRRGRQVSCQESRHKIDPADRFQVEELLTVQNGKGMVQLARLNLVGPKARKSVLIRAGDISVPGR